MKYIALPNPLVNMNHIYQAKQLVDDAFAAGYFKNHLDEIQCAWIALDDDKVVGWAAIGDCMLRCIVVHPDYRGQGIGKRLTEERLKYLEPCDSVISYAWVRPDGTCMSCKNLENFGFVLQEELPDYYNNTRQHCKYCGTNCNCIAKLYVRKNNV
jgi:ribosomal protein S18 acetylase RimI-like enzyme